MRSSLALEKGKEFFDGWCVTEFMVSFITMYLRVLFFRRRNTNNHVLSLF
jgi:hypothetical protein